LQFYCTTHFLNGIIEKFIFLFGLTDIGYFTKEVPQNNKKGKDYENY